MSDKGDITVPPADLLAALMQRPELADEVANRIIEDPTAASWLPAVPSQLVHRLLCEVGMGDAGELMELCAPAQVREVLDLELWQGDRVKGEEALDWIHFLSTLSDEVAMRHIRGLDIELLGWLLLRWCRIYLLDDGNFPEEPEWEVWSSPDNWYAVEVLTDNKAQVDQVTGLLDRLYREDPDDARRLLQNLLWELPSELEEYSYRWRTGRLEDLGFANPQESLLIYAYLAPGKVTLDESTADRPIRGQDEPADRTGGALTILVDDAGRSFWSRAAAGISDAEERERISIALMSVANFAMAADRIPPADTDAAGRSMEDLHLRLSLGLEHLCNGDLDLAGVALANVALMRLARLGHSLTLDLRRELLGLQREGKLGSGLGDASRLDAPLAAQVEGLLRLRPRFLETDTATHRAFRGRDELALARTWVKQAEAMAELGDELGLPEPYPDGVTIGAIFRAFVVRGEPGPVDKETLAAWMSEHLVDGKASEASQLKAEELAGGPLGRELLAALEEELGGVAPGDLDLRFVQGIWAER
jgi:hypothetical protein